MFVPSTHYTISVHVPLLQGDMPTVAIMRHAADECRVIKVDEILGRHFKDHVMLSIAITAERLAAIDKTNEIYAHLIFSGRAFGHAELCQMMALGWRDESFSFVTVPVGAQQADLVQTDRSLPMNHFKAPRLSLIAAVNYAYSSPGKVFVTLPAGQAEAVSKEFAAYSERTASIPANDPEAIMEYTGEGRVTALAVLLWHHFNAQRVRSGWARELAG